MALPALYKLAEQHHELLALGSDEELDEATLEAIRTTLEGLTGEIETKAQSIAATALNMDAWAKAADEAGKALRERAARIRRRSEALRSYLLAQLQSLELSKIEGPEFTVAIRKNPPAVQIAPEADLGDEWMVFPDPPPPTPDKKKIGAALKAGQEIAGCALTQSVRLEIRA